MKTIHAIQRIKNIEKYCESCSTLASFFRAERNQDKTASYKQQFDWLDFDGIDFHDGLANEDIPKIETNIILNINVF